MNEFELRIFTILFLHTYKLAKQKIVFVNTFWIIQI